MSSVDAVFVSVLFAAAFGAVLAGIPVAFALSGAALIVASIGAVLGHFDFGLLGAVGPRIFGTAMFNEVLTAVPLFILMGAFLERSRIAEDLLTSMAHVFGRTPAGLGVSVTLVGVLLAASTGIVGATVVAMGMLSLPTMLKRGYAPSFAAGSICASGTLGQIIPPSIVLVFLGDQLSGAYMEAQREVGNFSPEPVSVGDLFAGALVPGLGLAALYMAYQVATGVFRPSLCPPARDETSEAVSAGDIVFKLAAPIVLIVVVLGSILAGVATPTEAAGVGALGALLLAGRRLSAVDANGRDHAVSKVLISAAIIAIFVLPLLRSIADLRVTLDETTTWNAVMIALAVVASALVLVGAVAALLVMTRQRILSDALQSTMRVTTLAFVILIGATIFSLVFRGFGGDELVAALLATIPGGVFGAVIAVNIVIFVLGFFLDFIEIVFIIMPIVAPVILQSDIDPVWFGVLIAMNLQTSFLTPPFGFALFYLKGVAPAAVKTSDIYRGVLPFIGIQLLALTLVFVFPSLATWLPDVIFG